MSISKKNAYLFALKSSEKKLLKVFNHANKLILSFETFDTQEMWQRLGFIWKWYAYQIIKI
jgi:hypothetical protein